MFPNAVVQFCEINDEDVMKKKEFEKVLTILPEIAASCRSPKLRMTHEFWMKNGLFAPHFDGVILNVERFLIHIR